MFLFLVVRVETKENSEREKNEHREAQRAGKVASASKLVFLAFLHSIARVVGRKKRKQGIEKHLKS